jgi:hypothetical protein
VAEERVPPWWVRQDRLDRRDEAIRQYAEEQLADLPSDRAGARNMAANLALEAVLAPPDKGSHRHELHDPRAR